MPRAPGRETISQHSPPQQQEEALGSDRAQVPKETKQNYYSWDILKFRPQGSLRLLQQPQLCKSGPLTSMPVPLSQATQRRHKVSLGGQEVCHQRPPR
jgi:hypothetical protein